VDEHAYSVVATDKVEPGLLPTLVSLQGLANRDAPRLYLLPNPNGPEEHWTHWYHERGYEATHATAEEALVAHAHRAQGYVVYDPELPDSLNVAMVLAGLRDAVVCAPALEEPLRALGLSCIEDLRGRWNDKLAAYGWAADTLLNQCNASILANYEQPHPAAVRPTMDFLVAHRGFCMGLCINDADYPDEAALWERVQTAAPDHAMMLGWHTSRDTEATHVYFGSQHNVWVYCAGAWNMSFHQHIAAAGPYKQDHCETAKCRPDGRYVTITLSDGDSWHSMADVQKKFWRHPRRGEVPVGWEVAPVFAQVGPAILEYYFDTLTDNDYLVCGPSGIGYNYLSGFEDWQGYLDRTEKAMDATSLRTIWVINRVVRHLPNGAVEHRLKKGAIQYSKADMEAFGGVKDQNGADWVDPEAVSRYMQRLPHCLGFFQGWERIPGEGPRWVDGKAWCPTVALVRHDLDAVIDEFELAARHQPAPMFLAAHVNCYDCDMDTVIELAHRLEADGYTVVRPDIFLALAADASKEGMRGSEGKDDS